MGRTEFTEIRHRLAGYSFAPLAYRHIVTCSTLWQEKFVKLLRKIFTQDASGRRFMQTKQLGTHLNITSRNLLGR
jgi:hypothetical protein